MGWVLQLLLSAKKKGHVWSRHPRASLPPADGDFFLFAYTCLPCLPACLQRTRFLYADEGEVVLPTGAELEAANESLPGSRIWKGTILAPNTVVRGCSITTLDGMATPEDCARACQRWQWENPEANTSSRCNTFNHCGLEEGCRWAGGQAGARGGGQPFCCNAAV